jgi:hypothetical protein
MGSYKRSAKSISPNCNWPGKEKLHDCAGRDRRWFPSVAWFRLAVFPHTFYSYFNHDCRFGGAAAALAGYIGRTFIRSQETAARYLRAYFDQPLAFSRYLAAERLLSSQSELKSEERDAMLRIIVSAMVGALISTASRIQGMMILFNSCASCLRRQMRRLVKSITDAVCSLGANWH